MPEDQEYFSKLYVYGWIFCSFGVFSGVCILAYLILRYVFKYFMGPKEHFSKWTTYIAYGFIGSGFTISVTLFAFSLAYASSVQ